MVHTGVARQYFSRLIAPAKAWCHASKVASQAEKVNECRQSPFSWQNYADVPSWTGIGRLVAREADAAKISVTLTSRLAAPNMNVTV